jgi:hypothetical protein
MPRACTLRVALASWYADIDLYLISRPTLLILLVLADEYVGSGLVLRWHQRCYLGYTFLILQPENLTLINGVRPQATPRNLQRCIAGATLGPNRCQASSNDDTRYGFFLHSRPCVILTGFCIATHS